MPIFYRATTTMVLGSAFHLPSSQAPGCEVIMSVVLRCLGAKRLDHY